MPRRKPKAEEQTIEPILMLPPAKPRHRHEHLEDPYESLPGGVPRAELLSQKPIDRPMTATDIANRTTAQIEQAERADRYTRYLEAMARFGGDQVGALAEVYSCSFDQALERREELHADVKLGLGSSSLADTLERQDLSLTARAAILRKHAYSNNPAASLKAVDMANDLEGEHSDAGSFEQYLRMAKAQNERLT